MEEDKIILVLPGLWDASGYKNGEEVLVFMSLRTTTFKEFLDDVHKIVQADRRFCEYVLHYLIRTEDYGVVKSIILSDRDLQRVVKIFKTPKIFVTVKPKQTGTDAPFCGNQSLNQPGVPDKKQDNFFNPMSSQGARGDPFAYGGQAQVGYNFPTADYRMNQMPYFPAPCINGAGPNSAPYWPTPYFPGPGPTKVDQLGPNSAPVVNQPCPNSTLKVDQLGPNSAPVVNNPWPNAPQVVNQPRPNSTTVVNKPKPSSAPAVNKSRPSSILPNFNQSRPSSTPVVDQSHIQKRGLEAHDQFARLLKQRLNPVEDNANATEDDEDEEDEDDEESSC